MSLRPNARTEVRRSRYKVAVDAEEGRRRREDNMVEIRKNRREENLQKKRREGFQSTTAPQFPSQPSGAPDKKIDSLPQMVAGVCSDDGNAQLEATTHFRKLLSIERNPPIEEVVQSGVVPRLVEFLGRDDFHNFSLRLLGHLQTLLLALPRTLRLSLIMELFRFLLSFLFHQVMMFVNRLFGLWGILLVIHQNAEIWSLPMVL